MRSSREVWSEAYDEACEVRGLSEQQAAAFADEMVAELWARACDERADRKWQELTDQEYDNSDYREDFAEEN